MLALSMADIQAFERIMIDFVLRCAGNGRVDLQAVAPVSEDPLDADAIGNARWTGDTCRRSEHVRVES
jgi:hypothetical protein